MSEGASRTGWLSRRGPAIAYAALLLVASSRPSAAGPDVYGLDKVLHATAYGVLGLLLWRASGPRTGTGITAATIAIAIGIAVGLTDEWIQSHVPGRDASVGDLLADAVGVVSGVVFGKSFWSHGWPGRFAG